MSAPRKSTYRPKAPCRPLPEARTPEEAQAQISVRVAGDLLAEALAPIVAQVAAEAAAARKGGRPS